MPVLANVTNGITRLLRPFAQPLLRPLSQRFDLMLSRIESLERQIAALRATRPSDAAAHRTADCSGGISTDLSERVDTLTRTWLRLQNEVSRLTSSVPEAAAKAVDARLAEVGKDCQRRVAVNPILLQARILAPEKLAGARADGALRLELGCGPMVDPNYVNVDMQWLPGVDVIAEGGALPFETGSVDEIYSAHLVEHLPQEDMRRRLLPHWLSLLKPGGRFRAVTIDSEAMIGGLSQGSYSFEDFRHVLFGGRESGGKIKYNLFTPDSLRHLVEEAGFASVDVPVRGRRNGACFEFELMARAPAATSRK